MMNEEIIKKYNVPVPRYTSYPTANHFGPYTSQEYLKVVDASNNAKQNQLSFYIHIPFCRHLCHYCGCNSVAMARPEVVEAYVKALHQEIDLLLPRLDKFRRISQIHYGGGSPTALPINMIGELNEHLLSSFATIERPEIAIECHPGYLTEQDWSALMKCGFNRYSLGIQDFDNAVLKTVNRRPSLLPPSEIVAMLHQAGARVNMDFIYGLPLQTPDSFQSTIEEAIEMNPDRLVTFSYAHVPWVNKRQLILEKVGLPAREDKLEMFTRASSLLVGAGYRHIGMDHFVKPDDDLAIAFDEHKLHRNFQGYCPRRITAQVYAFGVSGISQLDKAYAQNTKDIPQYIESISRGELTITKGYELTRNQQITRDAIESLMCNYQLDWSDLADRWQLSVGEVKSATAYDAGRMAQLAADGILTETVDSITITSDGQTFVRNVAAQLDAMISDGEQHYSKPI